MLYTLSAIKMQKRAKLQNHGNDVKIQRQER